MKRVMLALSSLALIAGIATAWVGYGNPFREVTFHNPQTNSNIRQLFYVDTCNKDGLCAVKPEHMRVMRFSLHYQGHQGVINGRGNNPIKVLRDLGLSGLPRPNSFVAALKWCTKGQIIQEHAYDVSIYVVSLPDNPMSTASCVKEQVSGSFGVCITDPIGREEDCDQFAPLED